MRHLLGRGAVQGKQFVHFKFLQYVLDRTYHIAQRELLTIVVALKLWKNNFKGKVLRISTDSQLSMTAINTGYTRDQFMSHCIREMAWVCAEHQILLKAVYISLKANKLPDLLSRWYIPHSGARCRFKQKLTAFWKCISVHNNLFQFSHFW